MATTTLAAATAGGMLGGRRSAGRTSAAATAAAAVASKHWERPRARPPPAAPTTAALTMATAAAAAGKSVQMGKLPDECWVRIFAHLEACELCASASAVCAGALALASEPRLWVALLHMDFAASLPQRAVLQAWVMLHEQFHPRQLYIYKRQERSVDMDVARRELLQRGEQVREQERRQRRLRILNVVLVRVTHLLLCATLLASFVLLWMKLGETIKCTYYVVLAPLMLFEVFLFASSIVAFAIYFLRGASGWTFYWNRLRGVVRWLILYTSPCEGAVILVSACAVAPLLACTLNGDLPDIMLRNPRFRYLPPFAVAWVAALVFACSVLRRRAFSVSCAGSFALLWAPLVCVSVLLYLKLSVVRDLPFYIVIAPSLGVTSALLLFVSFLVVASFWLGYRGNRDWTEYAIFALLTLLTVLVPLLLLQLACWARLDSRISNNTLFLPLVLWLSGLLICAIGHVLATLCGHGVSPGEHLGRPPWRQQDRDDYFDTELLLPPTAIGGGVV